MTREEIGILNLLSYVELFEFPLKETEILTYFIGHGEVLKRRIKESLERLVGRKIIEERSGYYFFSGQEHLILTRELRKDSSIKIIGQARKVVEIISFIPWIRCVAITGALASLNSPTGDDIDLMIVTSRRRLWLTRFLVFILLRLIGLLRKTRLFPSCNRLCVNVWMDEGDLAIEGDDCDLTIALDIARSRILLDKGGVYRKLLSCNRWVGGYLPVFYREQFGGAGPELIKDLEPLSAPARVRDRFLSFLEFVVYGFQLAIINKNYPGNPHIKDNPSRLWQHPTNTRGKIMRRYKENLANRLTLLGIFNESRKSFRV